MKQKDSQKLSPAELATLMATVVHNDRVLVALNGQRVARGLPNGAHTTDGMRLRSVATNTSGTG